MRAPLCLAVVLVSTLAGCLAGNDASPPGLDLANEDLVGDLLGPLVTRTSCVGYNAITFVDGAQMRAHVPSNWTFTSPTGSSDLAILRIHVVGCADPNADGWLFHLVLSTPMNPDEPSMHHHDNPDAVLGVFATDPMMVTNLTRANIPAHNATFDWSESPTGDTVIVASDDGQVLRLVTLDPHDGPTRNYVWPATYSSGTDDIQWFWGHENATTRPVAILESVLGPASPVPDITNAQWNVNAWLGFDLRYVTGTPEG